MGASALGQAWGCSQVRAGGSAFLTVPRRCCPCPGIALWAPLFLEMPAAQPVWNDPTKQEPCALAPVWACWPGTHCRTGAQEH